VIVGEHVPRYLKEGIGDEVRLIALESGILSKVSNREVDMGALGRFVRGRRCDTGHNTTVFQMRRSVNVTHHNVLFMRNKNEAVRLAKLNLCVQRFEEVLF
jgi:hypothetical protein